MRKSKVVAANGTLLASLTLVVMSSAVTAPAQEQTAPPGLDHFKCYTATPSAVKQRTVTYKDQFGSGRARVVALQTLCNPVRKNAGKILNPRAHLTCYATRDVKQTATGRKIEATNQFGTTTVTVGRAVSLCVPSLKRKAPAVPGRTPDPARLVDHFRCYAVDPVRVLKSVRLADQFAQTGTRVLALVQLCNPVSKNRGQVRRQTAHLVCYTIRDGQTFKPRNVTVRNQFGLAKMQATKPAMLCLPSLKKVA